MSFPETHFPGFPTSSNLIASGTLNHALPVAIPQAISVLPTPVEKAPRAPYVQVCESAPTTTSPATTSPFSGSNACSMPICPTSKKLTIPIFFENSLMNFTCSALSISLLGQKWSGTMDILLLSKTLVRPSLLNSLTATGVVISFPRTISTSAIINCPETTESCPECLARIFWVIVIPMLITSEFVLLLYTTTLILALYNNK